MLSAGLLVANLTAEEAKLVMVTSSAGLPEGVDFSAKPQGYDFGVKLSFFLEGENFIRVKKDSLKANGWELGHFVKISKDFSQASFNITKKGDFSKKLDSLKMNGKLTMVTGNKVEKKTAKASTAAEVDIGPFKAQINLDPKNQWQNGVTISGNLDDIKSVHAKVNGQMVKNSGWSGSNKKRTFNFQSITDATEVQIEYWADTKEKVISFSK